MSIPAEIQDKIKSAYQGQPLDLTALALRALPEIAWAKQPGGPQFLLSDDPEYFRVPEGVALREAVRPGIVRLYVYHVNGMPDIERRITAVIENTGSAPMHWRFMHRAFAGPSKDYYQVGKSGLVQFFGSRPEKNARTLAPGEAAPIDDALEAARVSYDELVHIFCEIEIDQPARISILQTDPATPGPVAAKKMKDVLPPRSKMGAGRGLFTVSDYTITSSDPKYRIDTANGPVQLIVADGKVDPWITGSDSATTLPVKNDGNYGVMYSIRLERAASDGRALALLTWNPRSRDQWCGGMANAMIVDEGKFPAGVVEIPSPSGFLHGDDVALLQIYPPPPAGETRTIHLMYSPPGASCLPTPLVFVPVDWPSGK